MSHRTYAADVFTSDNSDCDNPGDIEIQFISNCSFYDDTDRIQAYCNVNTIIGSYKYTFAPSNSGKSSLIEFIDYNYNNINYTYFNSLSDNYWCFDKITFLIHDINNKWKTCDFGSIFGILGINNDCGNEYGAFEQLVMDTSSQYSVCYDDIQPSNYSCMFYSLFSCCFCVFCFFLS